MKKRTWIILLTCVFILGTLGTGFAFWVNHHIEDSTKGQIKTLAGLEKAQCALLLGAKVYENNIVSHIVYDRIKTALALYKKKLVKKILISGDHGRKDYDEVNTIKNHLLAEGVPSHDIFMDHAGFSTYDSIYRAKAVFDVKSMIIVTQRFHLNRSIFIANQLGIKAQGTAADKRVYLAKTWNKIREFLARVEDYFETVIFKVKPKFLGKKIPISGDGRLTQD